MSQQLKFNDGTVLDALAVSGSSTYFQGANRDSLEIQMAKTAITFDALDKLTADPANTAKLITVDGDKRYEHDNYSIRTELALRPVEITPATGADPAVTEDRFCITLAQLSYSELQAEQLQDTVDQLVLKSLEG